jgi:hypothetical protein
MPFRSLAVRVDALRAERAELDAALHERRQLARMRPWSWDQFGRGAILPLVLAMVVALVALIYDFGDMRVY